MTTTPNLWRGLHAVSPSGQNANLGNVVGLSNGNILVSWVDLDNLSGASPGRDIIGRILDAGGNPIGDFFQINSHGPANEDQFDIAATADGGFAIAYKSSQGTGVQSSISSIHFDRYNAAGVNTQSSLLASGVVGTDYVGRPEIEALDSGGFFVTFMRGSTTGNNFTRGVVVNGSGVGGAEFQAGSNSDLAIVNDVAQLSNGNVVVVNEDNVLGTKPKFTILTPAGAIVTGPTVVESPPLFQQHTLPAVAALEGGGFVVVYMRGGVSTRYTIYDNAGNVTKAPAEAFGSGYVPDVVALPDGGFVVFDGNGKALRFGSTGDPVGAVFETTAAGTEVGLTADGRILAIGDLVSGRVGLAIRDPRDDGSIINGTSGADSLTAPAFGGTVNGLAGNDVIYGRFGNDTLNGNNGNDVIYGGDGDDTINGGNHADTLYGGDGNDTFISNDQINGDHFDGGAGFDTLDLSNANVGLSGLTIDMLAGTIALGNGPTGETFVNIEAILTTNNADVVISGPGRTVINLRGGNDRLIVGDDDFTDGDEYDGGAGIDTFDLSRFNWSGPQQVTVNLEQGVVRRGGFEEIVRNFENIKGGGGTGEILIGNNLANHIDAGAGDDWLRGGGGADTLLGGPGNDTFEYLGTGDAVLGEIVDGGAGTDTILISGAGTFRLDHLTVTSIERLDFYEFGTGTRNAQLNASQFGAGFSERLAVDGSEQAGTLDQLTIVMGTVETLNLSRLTFTDWGNGGDVVRIEGDDSHEVIVGTSVRDIIFGAGGDDSLSGGAGDDELYGGAGRDTLNGGPGADLMVGGADNDDYHVDDAGDVIVEGAGEGTADRVFASVSYRLGAAAQIERLTTASSGGTTAIDLTGNGFNQQIEGNNGPNRLDGGGGADRLLGYGGDDIYIVDSMDDIVFETVGNGYDRVMAKVSYVLPAAAEIERLTTAASSATTAINLTGNGFDQQIEGNAGPNRLDGGGGADRLIGYGGDDTYIVDSMDDIVYEALGGGYDRVMARFSYVLNAGAEIERLTTTASASTTPLDLTGNIFGQQIEGNNGPNRLDGGGGADRLLGYGGDDIYIVDSMDDIVFETVGNGYDRVMAKVSYVLPAAAEIERLTTAASSATTAIDLTGNGFDQQIEGNNGPNRLDGGGGADRLLGYGGDDIYIVDSMDDIVFETVGNGYDRVMAKVSYALPAAAEIERLTTAASSATTAIDLTGNDFGQQIEGNAGPNRLAGRGGQDTLVGLAGDDVFVFSSVEETGVGATRDRITDFEAYGDDDTIDLSGFAQMLTFIGDDAFSAANQVRAIQQGANVLIQINTIGTSIAEGEILLSNTMLSQIDATDFFL